jgi:2',3'-cyclic-nucleotide 2'-phosphodiesterase (5'-nucleotidase family)
LDAGNLLFKKETLGPGTPTETAEMTAEIIISAFNDIGCHAFSPGSKDFAAGLDFIQEMQILANFPFISANILDVNGNRLFDPYLIADVEGVSVGVIGLASKFIHSDVYIQDPMEALNELVDEVDSQSDVLVLMFDSEEADISKLQASGYPIDLVIRSKSKTRSQDGGKRNIPAYSCGDRGKYLYQFDLTIADPNLQFTDLAVYENQVSQAEKKLNKMRDGNLVTDLYSTYKDDPQSLKKIETYKSQIQSAKVALGNSVNSIKMSKHELGKTVTDRPDILRIVDDGKAKINNSFGPQPPSNIGHDHDGDGIPDH